MPILNPNSTNYEHPWEPNLSDLHHVMEYNALGQPVLRTTLKVGQTDAFEPELESFLHEVNARTATAIHARTLNLILIMY